jgi:hypothetical protein
MRALLAAATTLNGILAGANADRLIVGIPALRKLGPLMWADYSRNADLAPSGMVFYPTLAIGGTVLTIAASVAAPASGAGRRPGAAAATQIAAGCALAGLLLTFKAAPNMLAVRHLGGDAEALQRRFDGFLYWSRLRGALQIGAFVAGICALSATRP